MLTREEIQRIGEEVSPELAKKLELMNSKVNDAATVEAELAQFFTKVTSDPKSKTKFNELVSDLGLQFNLPTPPVVEYADKRLSEVNARLAQMEEERERSMVLQKLQEYGITESEYKDLAKFQKDYGITDNLKAIDLYAKSRERRDELEPTKTASTKILKKDEWNEEDALKSAIGEMRSIRQTMMRR